MIIPVQPADCCPAPTVAAAEPMTERDWLVAAFRALCDPTRLDVFRLIAAQKDPVCVCDIVGRFEVSQPTISHHLKVLRDAGLVTVSRRGVWAYYQADALGLARIQEALEALRAALAAPAR